ncbi:MAG: hypothetical protein AAGA92_13130 [Planctomycetota bacterium]
MNSPGVVYQIRWAEIFPWLILFRALRIAFSPSLLILSLVGVIATESLWRSVQTTVGVVPPDRLAMLEDPPVAALAAADAGGAPFTEPPQGRVPLAAPETAERIERFGGPLVVGSVWFAQPFHRIVSGRAEGFWWLTACGLLGIGIWGVVGGACCRIAALKLTDGKPIGMTRALTFGIEHWWSTAGGVLIPLAGATALALLVAAIGLFVQWNPFAFGVAILWPAAVAAGFMLALALGGLCVGWPLVWSTVAVERTDAFDATTRWFAYTFQRPLHLVGYAVLAIALGHAGGLVAQTVAGLTCYFSEWALALGAGAQRVADMTGVGVEPERSMVLTVRAIESWKSLVYGAANAFSISYLWCVGVAVYLLMRQQIDSAEMDELSVEAPESPVRLAGEAAPAAAQAE